jgi:hypothetical protein
MALSVADAAVCQSRDRLPCRSIRPGVCIPHGLTLATRRSLRCLKKGERPKYPGEMLLAVPSWKVRAPILVGQAA